MRLNVRNMSHFRMSFLPLPAVYWINFVTFLTTMPRSIYILTNGVIKSSCLQLYVCTNVLNSSFLFSSMQTFFMKSDMCDSSMFILRTMGGKRKVPKPSRTASGVVTSARINPKTSPLWIAESKLSSVSLWNILGISVAGKFKFFFSFSQSQPRIDITFPENMLLGCVKSTRQSTR